MLKDLRCCSSVHTLLSPGFLRRLSLGTLWIPAILKVLRDVLWCYYRPYTVSSESRGLVSLRRLASLLQTSGWTCMFLNHISLSQFPLPKPVARQGCWQHTENLGKGGDGCAHHLSVCCDHFFLLFSCSVRSCMTSGQKIIKTNVLLLEIAFQSKLSKENFRVNF